ncbi:hypothetical protein BBF93_19045 [Hyphomonas sp. CACIAM 19H1]|uniref:hypothetical protein n=1 Tax=Hyphomonas sp. CACIAM 19H1 TaxID=1873716 RepID=UPI000DEE1539|nr:hypothetical protein [Hyphomonas sp. CACIAM 19H1]AXE66098.1 hypothetical protein BBF93_19045 [Hyphomonas sp. CACIAM 19H1]
MSLAYPVARSLEDALKPGAPTARSRREAMALARGLALQGLETSWLHLAEAEADALFKAIGADGPAGHLQRYEDTSGHAVVAVNWWKLVDPSDVRPPEKRAFEPAPPPPAEEDHTDDLYFRRGRTKTRRQKPADPNQLDLFSKNLKG